MNKKVLITSICFMAGLYGGHVATKSIIESQATVEVAEVKQETSVDYFHRCQEEKMTLEGLDEMSSFSACVHNTNERNFQKIVKKGM